MLQGCRGELEDEVQSCLVPTEDLQGKNYLLKQASQRQGGKGQHTPGTTQLTQGR